MATANPIFSAIQRARSRKYWDNVSAEDRRKVGERLKAANAKHRKAASDPRLPDTRTAQIIATKPLPTAVAGGIPSVVEVLGAPVEKLARERVNQQPDAASLDYDEREYRENIERRKLRIEYYELTGQTDKATLWEAQLGKSLERHDRERRREVVRNNRKELESEYLALAHKLMELEVEQMSDEELAADKADSTDDAAGEDAGLAALSDRDLTDGIAQMQRELALRDQETPGDTSGVQPAAEPEVENHEADDAPVLPAYSRSGSATYWEEIESAARAERGAWEKAEPEPAGQFWTTREFKAAFPNYKPGLPGKWG